MSPEDRKNQTIALLKEHAIPYIDWLPLTEDESKVHLRNLNEVGKRILCLFCLCGSANDEGDSIYCEYLKTHELWRDLSKSERSYLSAPTFGNQAHIDATWRVEGLYLLLWSVGLVSELPFPPSEAEVSEFIKVLPAHDQPPDEFLGSLKFRGIGEIMDASDLIYRLHWATRRPDCPSQIDGSVVREWHHAINWLTNYDGESWDWVATDT